MSYPQSIGPFSDVPHTGDMDQHSRTCILSTEEEMCMNDDAIRLNNSVILKKQVSSFQDEDYSQSIKQFQLHVDLAKSFVDVENEGKSPGKAVMDPYKGRYDFSGHEEASDEEIKLVTDYLSREELDVDIWQDDAVRLNGPVFCHFLFREPVDYEIINVHMRIMQKYSKDNGFEIYCMDNMMQREVLDQLEKYVKKRRLKSNEYDTFLARLTSVTVNSLRELNGDVFQRCRYIIFPLNNK